MAVSSRARNSWSCTTQAHTRPGEQRCLGGYIARPITLHISSSQADFDLTALWERKLDMALQLAFPRMFFTSAYASPPCPCLVDRATDTMVLFRPSGEKQFQVEVRSNPVVWEQVKATYQQWATSGKPDVTAYQFHVDENGNQQVVLPISGRATKPSTWTIAQPR